MGSLLAPALLESFSGDERLTELAGNLRRRLNERVDAGALELPLLPQVAMEVLALASNDGSDAKHLAELLRRDPAMTAHVLRIANSPLYRSRALIDSLPQAMSRLGFSKIRQIALVIACKQRVFRVRGFEPEVHRAFRHSLATALFAQEVARARHADEEEAFLAGLLHDIGRPVLLQAVADLPMTLRATDGPAVLAVVAELHARVGAILARKWNLPRSICDAIAYHHEPLLAPSQTLPMLVALAEDLALCALDANDGAASISSHWTLPHLNLPPGALELVNAQRPVLLNTLQAVA